MIEIKNISKTYGSKQVLHSIDGVFESGKTNLLIGSSGTGKSVLLKCIVGLEKPDVGNIIFDGRDLTVAKKNVQTQIRREIGMLFQGSALFDSKNAEQNVMFPLDILTKMSPKDKKKRVDFCLDRVGLANVNKLMPSEISGGMKKRVGIARAIVNNPNYLFCDEPNSGLDPQTSLVIDDLISDLTKDYQMTTLVVTHDMNSVLEMGDTVKYIYNGKKLWEGSSKNIAKSDVKELNDFVFANKMMKLARRD